MSKKFVLSYLTLVTPFGCPVSHASGADGTTMVVENEEPLPDFVLPHVGMMVKPQYRILKNVAPSSKNETRQLRSICNTCI